MKRKINIGEKAMLRIMVSQKDVHYVGGLVNGAYVLSLFGDLVTEVCARFDGSGSLLRGYNTVELLMPIYACDFLQCTGWISKVGNTSRIIELEAHRYIKITAESNKPMGAYLDDPELVAKAQAIAVVPKEEQFYSDE